MKWHYLLALILLWNGGANGFSILARKCGLCHSPVKHRDQKVYLCHRHWTCIDCANDYLKDQLDQLRYPISCPRGCGLKIMDERVRDVSIKLYKDLGKLKSSICSACMKAIPVKDDRVLNCEKHWTCKKCLHGHIKKRLRQGRISIRCMHGDCDQLIGDEIRQTVYKNYQRDVEKVIKLYSCKICLDYIDPDTMQSIYSCPDHFSCQPCFLGYLGIAIRDKKIPIICPGKSCTQEIDLQLIMDKSPESYEEIRDWHTRKKKKRLQRYDVALNEIEIKTLLRNNPTYTQCPECGAVIERTAGCEHMLCLCNHSFNFKRKRLGGHFEMIDNSKFNGAPI